MIEIIVCVILLTLIVLVFVPNKCKKEGYSDYMALSSCSSNDCPGAEGNVCADDGSMSYSCCDGDGNCGCTDCGSAWGCSASNTDCY